MKIFSDEHGTCLVFTQVADIERTARHLTQFAKERRKSDKLGPAFLYMAGAKKQKDKPTHSAFQKFLKSWRLAYMKVTKPAYKRGKFAPGEYY